MRQIVTLITDFGSSDYYAAVLKATILKRSRAVQIVDVSHSVSIHDIVEGAFFLKNSYGHFPDKSIHVVAIQNYVGESNVMIVFEHDGHYFIGPNNGLFSLVFPHDHGIQKYEVKLHKKDHHFLQDRIAHAVACINHGLPLNEIGPELTDFETKIGLRPVTTSTQIRATIIHIDHFGNVIVNLDKETFERIKKNRNFEIYYKGKDPITIISQYYNDVAIGDVLCMFNSANYLQLAINMGNAHQMLGLKKNETIQIDFLKSR